MMLNIRVPSSTDMFFFFFPSSQYTVLRRHSVAMTLDDLLLFIIVSLAFLKLDASSTSKFRMLIESHMFGTHVSKILYFLCPLSLLRLLFICKVDIRAPTTCTQWRRVCRAVVVCSSTGGMICHNQCRVFNIQIKMSLSHPSRPS